MTKDIKKGLPKEWEVKKFSKVFIDTKSGLSRKLSNEDIGVPVIRSGNINNGKFIATPLKYWYKQDPKGVSLDSFYLEDGDILINFINSLAQIGKVAIYEAIGREAIFTTNIFRARNNKSLLLSKFFLFFSLTKLYQNQILKITNPAVNQASFTRKSFNDLQIPLPPLPEQQRIVNKLDSLFSRIDEAISLVEATLEAIPKLKMASLDKAFKGQLLGDVELGKNGLPKGWEVKQVKDLSNQIQYGYTGSKQSTPNYYYVRITDIQDGKINWQDVPYSDISKDESTKYILNKGDILFARTGATVGKSYLFEDDVKAIFASYLIRVVVKQNIISPIFIYYFFQSNNYWQQVYGQVVGAAQPNVNGKKLGDLYISLPPLPEQQRIINQLDELFKNLEALQSEYKNKLKNLQDLKKSLLEQAFQGKL